MVQFFDALAYRFLARLPACTPESYYRMQRQAIDGGYCYSGVRGPYWFSLVRTRCFDLYWSIFP
jgi:hypothetical protein